MNIGDNVIIKCSWSELHGLTGVIDHISSDNEVAHIKFDDPSRGNKGGEHVHRNYFLIVG